MQELGQAGAGADVNGLVAEIVKQLVDGHSLADNGVGNDLNAHLLEVFDLDSNDLVLGQTELGNTVDQNAAGLVEGLVNGDVIAHLAQIARAGEAGGAGADDGDLVAVGLGRDYLGLIGLGHMVVGNEALETADADGLALDAADALGLALLLLRTYTAADRGQGVC